MWVVGMFIEVARKRVLLRLNGRFRNTSEGVLHCQVCSHDAMSKAAGDGLEREVV